jgi:PQQ-dependent catabolism-associated CXXCW motif protein
MRLDVMKGKYFLAVAIAAAGALRAAAAAETVAEPPDYRMEDYRAPVPATLKGAVVVSTDEARALWEKKQAIFFDVMPRIPKPDKLPAGTIWRDKVRMDIAGSIWLSNVGYGALSAEMSAYFHGSLSAGTKGDKSVKILFYCMTDCWMSWNAAKRAVEWGYSDVVWYPKGADGWSASGLPLVEAKPFELR